MRRRLLLAAAFVSILAFAAWRWLWPDPAAILASIEVPPSPVLSAQDELATFRTAPGFRVELVAAEPLVVDPVAVDWDDEGLLYVVEMRGFMPDIDGTGEDRPTGRVVILEDVDGDGRMDRSDVFLDQLVLPRAIAVLPEGVLIGAPPDLWLCRDTDGDRHCDERTRLSDYAADVGNVEHRENGLLAGLDGWIYNSKSSRRFRLDGDAITIEQTAFRGQWGIAQDDEGRLYYNHNSAFLFGDAVPARYAMRHPATATSLEKPGLNIALSEDAEVFGIRVAPGLNRAYLAGRLRRDGRQRLPDAVSGLAIQRGDQYGPDFVGDAFVPESAGAAVAHFAIERDGLELRAEHRLRDDETWAHREFLASTDERFRPVDADFGPDGAIWVVDMYRGVIQHADYVSDYLRSYVKRHGLEPPGATGRIWRIVREDRPISYRPPSLSTLDDQLAALDHPNGWVRDRAQRRIAYTAAPGAIAGLRQLGNFGPLGRRHALWALDRMGALDAPTWRGALADADPEVRKVALRTGEALQGELGDGALAATLPLLEDVDPAVRLQALHTLGSLPLHVRPLDVLLDAGRGNGPLEVQASVSGLAGLELAALGQELARAPAGRQSDDTMRWLRALVAAAHLDARERPNAATDVAQLLDLLLASASGERLAALLDGIDEAQQRPGTRRIELAEPHALFHSDAAHQGAVAAAVSRIRRHFTWPGDASPGGARPLTPEEVARRSRGEALFVQSCATCHGEHGRGTKGLAPPLVASPWVRDADDWLVRIALHGLTGPLRIDGTDWNLTMPGHGHDPRFDDEALSGLLTHLRRSWGHAEEPVAPATIARIRAETADRSLPWTTRELRALPIEHRLDRYVGVYRVPIVGIELAVRRSDSSLVVGRREGGASPLDELGNGSFGSPEMMIQFELDESGAVTGASGTREGTTFPLSKVE